MFLLNDEEVEYYYKCKASNEELELVTFMEVRNIIHKLIQVISDDSSLFTEDGSIDIVKFQTLVSTDEKMSKDGEKFIKESYKSILQHFPISGRIQNSEKIPKKTKKTVKKCKKCAKNNLCKKCIELLSSKVCVINDVFENEGGPQIDEKIGNTKLIPKFGPPGEKFKDKQLMLQLLKRILADFTGLVIKKKKMEDTEKAKANE
jgi:hypothetical protein